MPGISQWELRNLGISTLIINELSTEVSAMSRPTGPATGESFTINPYAGDINPSTESGSKLYLKAMEEVPQKDKLYISISNGTKVSDMLEKC